MDTVAQTADARRSLKPSVVTCRGCGTRNRVSPAAAGSPRCARCHRAVSWVVDADDATFDPLTEGTRLPVIIDLWAPWCGPCRVVGPALEQLAEEFAGRVKLVKVNVDHAPATQGRFGVRGIPTLVLLRDGREAGRKVGAAPLGDLRAWLESSMGDR